MLSLRWLPALLGLTLVGPTPSAVAQQCAPSPDAAATRTLRGIPISVDTTTIFQQHELILERASSSGPPARIVGEPPTAAEQLLVFRNSAAISHHDALCIAGDSAAPHLLELDRRRRSAASRQWFFAVLGGVAYAGALISGMNGCEPTCSAGDFLEIGANLSLLTSLLYVWQTRTRTHDYNDAVSGGHLADALAAYNQQLRHAVAQRRN